MANYNYRSANAMRRTQNRVTDRCMSDPLSGMPLAMAYVPWQEWQNLYSAEKALCRGTIFEELDKPFLGRGGCIK